MTATNTRAPGARVRSGQPAEGCPHHEPAVALAERRRPGEQAEVDREAVAVPRPHLATEAGHPEPHHVAVERDRERERPRVGGVRVGELEGGEREQHRCRGIDAEALRVGPERLPRAAEPAPYPVDTVRGRTPRIQHRPDVPEEDLQYGHAQPEDDVDERRREVHGGRRLADERGQEDEREQPDRHGAGNDPQPRRAEEPLEALRQRPPHREPLELRPLPERAEREKRDDEDDGAAPEEEPGRNRQVPDPADAVRDDPAGTITA